MYLYTRPYVLHNITNDREWIVPTFPSVTIAADTRLMSPWARRQRRCATPSFLSWPLWATFWSSPHWSRTRGCGRWLMCSSWTCPSATFSWRSSVCPSTSFQCSWGILCSDQQFAIYRGTFRVSFKTYLKRESKRRRFFFKSWRNIKSLQGLVEDWYGNYYKDDLFTEVLRTANIICSLHSQRPC